MSLSVLVPIFVAVSSYFNLPPGLLSSLCFVESGYKVTAVHKDDGPENSVGVCQIHTSTARMLGFRGATSALMAPYANILYAGAYLRHQLDRYKGDVKKAIGAYNSGTYTPKNKVYTDKVLKVWRYKNENSH